MMSARIIIHVFILAHKMKNDKKMRNIMFKTNTGWKQKITGKLWYTRIKTTEGGNEHWIDLEHLVSRS